MVDRGRPKRSDSTNGVKKKDIRQRSSEISRLNEIPTRRFQSHYRQSRANHPKFPPTPKTRKPQRHRPRRKIRKRATSPLPGRRA